VTNGGEADVMVLIAVTDPSAQRHRLSAFIVETDAPGISIGKLERRWASIVHQQRNLSSKSA
jgi:alkylation response protein AidB-like acyl-CoA dehydrogenase